MGEACPDDAAIGGNASEADPAALVAIIKELKPLSSEERHRTVNAAMVFLGEGVPAMPSATAKADQDGLVGAGADSTQSKWMEQHGVSEQELDRAFHFDGKGSFDLLDAPGSSKRERTLNTYILTGLGAYLARESRTFDDATARGFCEQIGCYDASNHAATLREKGAEFTGDKNKDYVLTNVGIQAAVPLVKALAK